MEDKGGAAASSDGHATVQHRRKRPRSALFLVSYAYFIQGSLACAAAHLLPP